MNNFELYNRISSPIIILEKNFDVIFANSTFLKYFGKKIDLKKIKNSFNFEVCVLQTENIQNLSPIDFAINSDENFHSFVSFQSESDSNRYFLMESFLVDGYKLIIFNDYTQKYLYQALLDNNNKLTHENFLLSEENQKFLEIKQKAQNQAIKMALLNRVSNSIRETMDVQKTLENASKELYSLLAAYKLQYAKYIDDSFLVEYSYPSNFEENVFKEIQFDLTVKNDIFNRKILISSVLSEYKNSKEKLKSPVTRIIIPIHHSNHLFGVIIIFTKNKQIDESLPEILEAISAQLASAIVQAYLFKELNNKNSVLEKTLKELKETQLQLINTEKMASLGQLIAGVAHEINTPLASINSNNSILSKLLAKASFENSARQMIDDVLKVDTEAIKRISNIVKSLKKFVRLDEAQLQKADINTELDLTLTLIEHETKNKVKITKNYGKIPQINCYPNMLNQVFMNILVNASQSIEKSGEIVITTKADKKILIIIFEDTGCGMSEETIQKIFLPGFTTKGSGVGTGLGLAISRKIIEEKHKGSIEVQSELSRGSKFIIKIPV